MRVTAVLLSILFPFIIELNGQDETEVSGTDFKVVTEGEVTDINLKTDFNHSTNPGNVDKHTQGSTEIYYSIVTLNEDEAETVNSPINESVWSPLAYGLDKFLGCAYSYPQQTDFTYYWNQLTPENAGKWGSVEGTRDVMTWNNLDAAYQLAMDSNLVYKHHVLVWGSQQPDWMAALDSAEQHAEIQEWFDSVAYRYPGMEQVEVVNEPLHQPPDDLHEGGYIGALGGSGTTGWDWIIEAFRMARETFPDTVALMINEYGVMSSTSTTDQYLHIIRLLQDNGSLIDAIGLQAHAFSQGVSNDVVLRNLDSLATTGLPIYITELDIDGETDLKQVHGYMNLFPLFWEYPAVQGITLWGFRPGMWRTAQKAYLIDGNGEERPALLWLRAYLKNEFVPNESVAISTSTGELSIDTDNGTLQMVAEVLPDTSTLKTVHWTVSDANVATIDQNGLLTALRDGTVTVTGRSLELDSDLSDQMDITISNQVLDVEGIAGAENIRIYPNPSDGGRFTIDGMQNITSVTILDIYGKLIFANGIENQPGIEINLDVPAGLYIVRLSDGKRFYHAKISVR